MLLLGDCSTDASFQLHHFSDASEFGYGTDPYLRKEAEDRSVKCSFVIAKSRAAPLQYVSVPRLELQAATIAGRVQCMILKETEVPITSSFFWTDSKITLQYINNESRRFKTYVANRVSEIRDASQPKKWRQVQILAVNFWKRWLKEYVLALQERQKWQRSRRNAEAGDLVLLVDECLPRGQWRLGEVIRVVPGRDGLVRTAEVRTGTTTSLVRPIQRLCLLEESANL